MIDSHAILRPGTLVKVWDGYRRREALAVILSYFGRNTVSIAMWLNHAYRVRLLKDDACIQSEPCYSEYAHTNPASDVFLRIVEVLVEM